MRRLTVTMMVAAATALMPIWAMAGNQEIAEGIANSLRQSGQLEGYRIGVKFQDGTASLRGRVASHEQMNWAMKLVFETPGVTRVVNDLTVGEDAPTVAPTVAPERAPRPSTAKIQSIRPIPFRAPRPAAVEQAAATAPVVPLKQASGAIAPEQTVRPAPESLRTAQQNPSLIARATSRLQRSITSSRPPKPAAPPVAQKAPPVERVATSFTQKPLEFVAALTAPRRKETPKLTAEPKVAAPMAAPKISAHHRAAAKAAPRPIAQSQLAAQPQPVVQQQAVVQQQPAPVLVAQAHGMPMPMVPTTLSPQQVAMVQQAAVPMPAGGGYAPGAPMPQYVTPVGGMSPVRYDQPHLPNHAWPSYASYPNYAALTYPRQHSPQAWPYIGPFYPYPQVPMGWRKVTMEWHDGWWNLDFDDGSHKGFLSGLFRPHR